jgi:hypothetical protein
MRLFRTRLHAYVALVLLACLVIAGVVFVLLPRDNTPNAPPPDFPAFFYF